LQVAAVVAVMQGVPAEVAVAVVDTALQLGLQFLQDQIY
jgi:hypothetical protein